MPSFAALWGLLRRESFDPPPLIERVSVASSRHAVGVCRSLRVGVLDAIGALLSGFAGALARKVDLSPPELDGLHEQALTVVYRVLFLLFAESRGLVPLWHPVYRKSYSIEALRDLAEVPGRTRGLWEALQAISRLAHSGCRAGNLRVTPFNGRLFAPATTPLAESGRLDDEAAKRVVLALSTTSGGTGTGRTRISYRDLGVEQLGAVYESVLDYRPRLVPAPRREPAHHVDASSSPTPHVRSDPSASVRPHRQTPCRTVRRGSHGRSTRAWQRRQEGHGHLLHAARPHDIPGAADIGPAGGRRLTRGDSRTPRRRSRDGQRRVSRGRLPLPRRARTSRRSSPPAAATRATSRTRIAACSAGSSRSAASTVSIAIPSRCSWRGCRSGCARWRRSGR